MIGRWWGAAVRRVLALGHETFVPALLDLHPSVEAMRTQPARGVHVVAVADHVFEHVAAVRQRVVTKIALSDIQAVEHHHTGGVAGSSGGALTR